MRVHIRSLLRHSTETLWEMLRGDFTLVFDDGSTVQTNYKECIYSSFAWDYYREYPDVVIDKNSHVTSITKGNRITTDTDAKLAAVAFFNVYDTYKDRVADKKDLLDHLSRRAYETTNKMYNYLSYKAEAYVESIDIVHIREISKHPRIVKVKAAATPSQEGIDSIYDELRWVLSSKSDIKYNPVVKANCSKLIKTDQTLQCLGPRGYLTDIDSWIFREPIMSGYVSGITTMADSMMESRSAAKALAFSEDPLQKAEYFSRRQQLICQNVKNLYSGDCGSQKYLLWQVRGEEIVDGVVTRQSDLKTIFGKYYLNEETGKVQVIKKTDTHLIGKTIKIRDVVAGCNHPAHDGVCEVCFGEASITVPKHTNLGHMSCVSMNSIITQLVLSTKHFDGTSVVEGIRLNPCDKRYLHAVANGNDYYLSSELKNKRIKLKIDSRAARGLADIALVDDVHKLAISRVSEIEYIHLIIDDGEGVIDEIPLSVVVNKRLANMTHALLRHCKRVGWGVTDDNKYIIDMDGWDMSQPILSLPLRHFSMTDFQGEIAKVLESTVKDMKTRDTVIDPTVMLIEFHDLVNKRITINLSILSIIIYSSMVVSATEGNYALPKPWTTSGLGVMRLIIDHRSLSAKMAYQGQVSTILSPNSYLLTNRPDHLFDDLICCAEMQQMGVI